MGPNNFTEDDKIKTIEFLNFIAKRAKFDSMSTQDIIEYFRLLSFMQQVLVPKVNSHILEITRVVEAPKVDETLVKEEPKKKGK